MNYIFHHNSKFREQIKTTLNENPIKEKQYERENVTWIGILFSAIEFYILFLIGIIPPLNQITFFSFKSIFYCLLSHLLPVEFIYYWVHVLMHHPSIYGKLHKHHHLSIITTAKTAVSFLALEHLFYDSLFALPIIIPCYLGYCSIVQLLFYIPLMDLANTFGHINIELFSLNWYNTFLGNIFYSTSYHHIHHKYFKYNFALFVPIYDYIFGTYNIIYTEKEHTLAYYKQNNNNPKYAFLIHIFDKESTAKNRLISLEYARTNDLSKLLKLQKKILPLWNLFVYIVKYIPIFIIPHFFWNLFDCDTKHPKINGIIRPILRTPYNYINNRSNTFNMVIQSCRQLKIQYPNINTIGLAAMNKNKLFNNNGIDMLPFINSMGMSVVTGNTMTAASVYEYIKRDIPFGSKIYINGATSSIGQSLVFACASFRL